MNTNSNNKEIIDVDCVEVPSTQPCISPLSPSQDSINSVDKKAPTIQKRKHSTDTSISTSSRLKIPALSSKASKEEPITLVLNDQSLYIDDKEFFRLIQEDGFSSKDDQDDVKVESIEQSPSKRRNYSRNLYKHNTNNKSYRDIHALSDKLMALYANRTSDVFVKLFQTSKKKNVTKTRQKICKWILENRRMVSKKNFSSVLFPEQYIYSPVLDEDREYVYILQQKLILRLALAQWGYISDFNRKKLISYNIRARIFGVIFDQENRDIMPKLLDKRANNRSELDDPQMTPRGLYEQITAQVNDINKKICHPEGWADVVEAKRKKYGVNSDQIELWTGLDPNEILNSPDIIDYDDVQTKFLKTLKDYKTSMRLWTSGTGGGSGAPADYCCWQNRSPEFFENYPDQQGALLTWIYMWDISLQNPLAGSVELLEDGFEAGKPLDFDDKSLSSKRSKTSIKTDPSEMESFINRFHVTTTSTLGSMEQKMNNALEDSKDNTINEMGKILNIIGTCNAMKTSLKRELELCTDDSERDEKKDQIKTLEVSIAGMFAKLKEVQQK